MKINEPEAYMKFKCSPVQKKKKKKGQKVQVARVWCVCQ